MDFNFIACQIVVTWFYWVITIVHSLIWQKLNFTLSTEVSVRVVKVFFITLNTFDIMTEFVTHLKLYKLGFQRNSFHDNDGHYEIVLTTFSEFCPRKS